jgi:GH43 family beta-xylosidase
MKVLAAAGSLILVVAVAVPGQPPAGAEVRDFYNVVAPSGADPWVIRHADGHYYMTVTTGDNVTLWRSATLTGLWAGERKVVWTPPAAGPKSRNIWAPELHRLDGKWYVYYAADDGDNANHRMYVLENPSADPFRGAFTDKGKIHDPADDRWAIDGTVLDLKGKRYFIWSGWEKDVNVRQVLYIAPMTNPWTLGGRRVEISRPEHPWETVGDPDVNEGPQVLVTEMHVHLVYSASGSWTDSYCLGLLTLKTDDDPLAPASWVKHPKPVFESGHGVFGPGHCSFVKSPDGSEDWLVYHAARFRGAGWTRNVRAQKFDRDAAGMPRFGTPARPDVPIPLPGGEPARRRYEAESAALGGNAKAIRHAGASGGFKVGGIDTPQSHVEFTVTAKDRGPHTLAVRFENPSDRGAVASHTLSVNGVARPDVTYENAGRGNGSVVTVPVELKAGANTIRLGNGKHAADVDCIDIAPR